MGGYFRDNRCVGCNQHNEFTYSCLWCCLVQESYARMTITELKAHGITYNQNKDRPPLDPHEGKIVPEKND